MAGVTVSNFTTASCGFLVGLCRQTADNVLLSKVSEEVATEIAKKISAYNLIIFPDTRISSLHYAADSVGRTSFKFFSWAP